VATYAIGDVQGCYAELCALLEQVRFDPAVDCLWFLGDLINRGPDSLRVVRLVRSLGDSAITVLGNHDLHFLAIHLGGHSMNKNDTFVDLLNAEEADEIADWYCQQRLIVADKDLGYAMVHAGIPHIWSLEQAISYATEVQDVVRGPDRAAYFQAMYGNNPDHWSDRHTGMDRLRVITNYLTRMRLLDDEGRMNFSHKGSLHDAPRGWRPWYEMRMQHPLSVKLLFGHWAALENGTGHGDVIALDTGCVWGRELTAMCLESGECHAVPARRSI
jgi:bis(5'-nucleosyl)-tetraphosphatase (symmetrical)